MTLSIQRGKAHLTPCEIETKGMEAQTRSFFENVCENDSKTAAEMSTAGAFNIPSLFPATV